MHNRRKQTLRRVTIISDVLSVLMAMPLAFVAQKSLRGYVDALKQPAPVEQFLLLAYFVLPMMVALLVAFDLHKTLERNQRVAIMAWRLGQAHIAGLMGVTLLVFATKVDINRSIVGLFLFMTFMLTLSFRAVSLWIGRRIASHVDARDHVLLVGDDLVLMESVCAALREDPASPNIVAKLLLSTKIDMDRSAREGVVNGGMSALTTLLHHETVDAVLLVTTKVGSALHAEILGKCEEQGKPLRRLIAMDGMVGRIRVEELYGLPFLSLLVREPSSEAMLLKRAIDLVVAFVALLILAPIMLAAALAILVTMGWPLVHVQDRIGLHGRRFRMVKFRSMVRDAEAQRNALAHLNEADGPVFKIAADPRVTRLGRFMRKCSIDELPQLFNVLAGTMSLVGPRPLPVAEQQEIHGAMRRRLCMRPGITGLWQISGRSDLKFEDWIKKDLEYVDHWSIWLDLKILLFTVPAVVSGRGAR